MTYLALGGWYIAASALGFYILWIFYLAVMNLKRVKDAGLMTKTAMVFGYPILLAGWLIDFIINAMVLTLILLEWPKEMTVTARLKRHNASSTGWRKAVAVWFEPLLDPYDPSGDHI